MAEPKPLPIVGKDFNGVASTVSKNEHTTRHWILCQQGSAALCQPVNPEAEVDVLNGYKDGCLRAEG